jgi:NADH dehydrogenase FAD-containing subunit
MGKHLVIVGAGHAHLTILKNLEKFTGSGYKVTVVNSSPFHYYSGMGPGMLSGIYKPEEIRFNVKKMSEDRGAAFVEDRAVHVHPDERKISLQSGHEIAYDVISFNTGSFVPVDDQMHASEAVITAKPIENLLKARGQIIDALKDRAMRIAVVGGGPTGVEVAGNLERLVKTVSGQCRITLIAGTRLLAESQSSIRRRVLNSLLRRNVKVIENAKAASIEGNTVKLTNGENLESDIIFMTVGVRPSPLFEDSGMPTGRDGGMLVNQYLQSVAYTEIFGGGDCISFKPQPLAKVGVYAVRQNPILLHNLLSTLSGDALKPFVPQKSVLLAFNLGDGTAVVGWHSLIWGGKLGFALKNYIDRSFMKTFQVSGELL